MKQHRIYEIQQQCYECQKCPLGQKRVDGHDPHVFGSGHVNADFMFVGEAPGADEVRLKRPLVGRSGCFYENRILKGIELERSHVYTTNAVLCRPNEKNRTPFPGEIELCRNHLDAQILLINPKLIITLGNAPLYSVCEVRGITKKHGVLRWSRVWSDGRRIPVFPMFHPAYCLRGSGLTEMADDISKLKKLASGLVTGSIYVEEDIRTLCDLEGAACIS